MTGPLFITGDAITHKATPNTKNTLKVKDVSTDAGNAGVNVTGLETCGAREGPPARGRSPVWRLAAHP